MVFRSGASYPRFRRGFTLVELLVVIAIIGTLMATLLPALSKARDIAKLTACSANMRSIYVAIGVYASEYSQFLPNGWYIPERQWQGYTSPIFMHNKMVSYIPTKSKVWYDPGWDINEPYFAATIPGNPDTPSSGTFPATPYNLGEGYYYICWASSTWVTPNTPQYIRFGIPRDPTKAEILFCMCDQQAPTLGNVGPHRNGTTWQVLYLDGHTSLSKGYLNGDFAVYCNSAGIWSP